MPNGVAKGRPPAKASPPLAVWQDAQSPGRARSSATRPVSSSTADPRGSARAPPHGSGRGRCTGRHDRREKRGSAATQDLGQEATIVDADLACNEPIELVVEAQDEAAMGLRVDGEVDQLIGVAFEVE